MQRSKAAPDGAQRVVNLWPRTITRKNVGIFYHIAVENTYYYVVRFLLTPLIKSAAHREQAARPVPFLCPGRGRAKWATSMAI